MKRTLLWCLVLCVGCGTERAAPSEHDLEGQNLAGVVNHQLSTREETDALDVSHTLARVGVLFRGTATLQISTSADGKTFTAWKPFEVLYAVEGGLTVARFDPPDEPMFFKLKRTGPAPRFLRVDGLVNVSDFGLGATAAFSQQGTQGLAAGNIVSRAAWGAAPSICDPGPLGDVFRATIHHTANFDDEFSADPAGTVRAIQAFHQGVNGWCDIGYHYLISADGRVWEGRPSGQLGSHAGGANSGNLGINLMGEFSNHGASDTMLHSAAALLKSLSAQHPGLALDGAHVLGHRDHGGTACPGDRLYAQLPQLIALTGSVQSSGEVDPFGDLNFAGTDAEGFTVVTGWAIDPETASPIDVHVYDNDVFAGAVTANGSRPDVAAVHPASGAAHGYQFRLNPGDGAHRLCTYAINVGAGVGNPLLGCKTISIANDPFGYLDGASVSATQVAVWGWTADPNFESAIDIHVYGDGKFLGSSLAEHWRPDVTRVFPTLSPWHGYEALLNLTAPIHQVCTYAINARAGTRNTLLGCMNL